MACGDQYEPRRLLGPREGKILVMPSKKPFVLRIDPELLAAVEKWAADEFRSTNGQMEWIINKVLKEANRLPKKKK
jgi:hypothetical protein